MIFHRTLVKILFVGVSCLLVSPKTSSVSANVTVNFFGEITDIEDGGDAGGLLTVGQCVEFVVQFDENSVDTNPSPMNGDFLSSLTSAAYDIESGLVSGSFSPDSSLHSANVVCDDMSCVSGSESLFGFAQFGTQGDPNFAGLGYSISRSFPPVSITDPNLIEPAVQPLLQADSDGTGSFADAANSIQFQWDFKPVPEPGVGVGLAAICLVILVRREAR